MKKLDDYKKDYDALHIKAKLSGKAALDAVKRNAFNLKYVMDQTEEICLIAVKQNGYVLAYVKEQTPAICLAAVNQNITVLEYVNDDMFYKNHKKLVKGLGE